MLIFEEDDLETILKGRPWLFRKILVLFTKIVGSIKSKI